MAHGFFPPPNGATAAGDVHFDTAEPWTCAPAAGGIGLGIVALHEFGHAIGLNHEETGIAAMNPFYNAALTFGPLADDIIGAGEIYGEAGAASTSFFGPVGIGTTSAADPLHIVADIPALRFENDSADDWRFRAGNGGNFVISDIDSPTKSEFLLTGAGDLTIAGGLVTTGGGGACTVGDPCDGVFQPAFELESIEEHAAFMWDNSHLKGVGPTNGDGPINITQKTGGLINELEKAHIYIERLNDKLKEKEAAIDQLSAKLRAKGIELAQVRGETTEFAQRLKRLEALLLDEDR